jgi:hypothetical protein
MGELGPDGWLDTWREPDAAAYGDMNRDHVQGQFEFGSAQMVAVGHRSVECYLMVMSCFLIYGTGRARFHTV